MAFLRSLVMLVLVGGIAIFSTTIPIGDHTLFGHMQRIWNAEETRELVRSVTEESGPAIDRVKRGFKAGLNEATRDQQPVVDKAEDSVTNAPTSTPPPAEEARNTTPTPNREPG